MSIHETILGKMRDYLQDVMMDNLPNDDPTKAGVIMLGPLQGNPEPDAARISITLHENDPDGFYGKGGISTLSSQWEDEINEVECGGSVTWKRRFTVKARCLLVNTGEDLTDAREIASKVRSRLELAVLRAPLDGLSKDGEFVSRAIVYESLQGEMVQAGGPPNTYDYHIKVRFEVETTIGVIP